MMKTHPYPRANLVLGSVAALAGLALVNVLLAKSAEARNPPLGGFLTIGGTKLHYMERGSGPALVLLHGNGTMLQDFVSSGLIDRLASDYRVIAFDRPGFGHSERPHGIVWDAEAQAQLIHSALRQLDVSEAAVVLGHSWGTLVALALAVNYPAQVRALIVISGYYFPTLRLDAALATISALPLVGTAITHTIAPIVSRAMWPLAARKLFGPRRIPAKFNAFPREMAVRPSQLKAVSEEAALMIPSVGALKKRYQQLKMPVVIMAGEDDRVIDPTQSERLSRKISGSLLMKVPGHGHMLHQTATTKVLTAAIAASDASLTPSNPKVAPASPTEHQSASREGVS